MLECYGQAVDPFNSQAVPSVSITQFKATTTSKDAQVILAACLGKPLPSKIRKIQFQDRSPGESNLRHCADLTSDITATQLESMITSSISLMNRKDLTVETAEQVEQANVKDECHREELAVAAMQYNYDRLWAKMETCQIARQCHNEYLELCADRLLLEEMMIQEDATSVEDIAEFAHLAAYISGI